MKTLAIDTATETLSVALGDSSGPMGETGLHAGRSHLELLMPTLTDLLGQYRLPLTGLDAICVGTGPGTFSGLRVGVATARALAQALELPLFGSSSLAALAAGLAEAPDRPGELLLPVIDAKRAQVFSRLYRLNEAGKPLPESEIMCLSAAELVDRVSELAGGRQVFAAGDGIGAYEDYFRAPDGPLTIPAAGSRLHRVQARYHLGAVETSRGYSAEALMGILPVYVRDPDADKTILLRKREPWLQ